VNPILILISLESNSCLQQTLYAESTQQSDQLIIAVGDKWPPTPNTEINIENLKLFRISGNEFLGRNFW